MSPPPSEAHEPDLAGRDPVRRAEVLEATVADGILLVDRDRVRAHGLNASAAAVWRATAGDPTVAAVVERVAESMGAPARPIAAEVRRTIIDLADEGLLRVGARPVPPSTETPMGPLVGLGDDGELVEEPTVAEGELIGPFRGLDVTFDLVTADAGLRTVLAEVWAPLAVGDDRVDPTGIRHYRIARTSGGARPADTVSATREVSLDGRVVARVRSDSAAVAHAVWHANQLVSTATVRFLQLHAAGLVVDGHAVLLPAQMNSGKSTLATALVEAGAGYLTDETVALDLVSAAALPYPKAITLDPGSWSRFERLEPPFLTEHPHLAHGKWYVDPDAVRAGATIAPTTGSDGVAGATVAVGSIVFPTYAPHRPTDLVRLDPVAAAAELSRNAFNLVVIGQAGVDLIARLAESVPCWSLSTADVESGVAAVLDAARA